jgi:hypothetical protein
MGVQRAYEEMVDFIAAGPSAAKVIEFRPSAGIRARVADLIRREKTDGLSEDETSELEHYLQLEHVMRLARARAKQHAGG